MTMALCRVARGRMTAGPVAPSFRNVAGLCFHAAEVRPCAVLSVRAGPLSIERAASSWSRPESIALGGWAHHTALLH